MKLSTLLLTSAALVVAGSAFAADLPAKKGAPAAKATGCSAFGAGFFQIPGDETCIKFSGYMRNDTNYSDSNRGLVNSPNARINFDVRSNTDIGALRGFTRLNYGSGAGTMDRAYVSIGGLSAGKVGGFFDISGSNGINFGSGLGSDSGTGVYYAMPMGGATATVGAQNNGNGVDQDVVGGLKLPAGPATVNVVAASHKNAANQGYAVAATVSVPAGGATVNVYGGVSNGAGSYVGGGADNTGSSANDGTAVGITVLVPAGAGTLYFDGGQTSTKTPAGTARTNSYGLGYDLTLAKNLHLIPEVFVVDGGSTSAVLRINRDF